MKTFTEAMRADPQIFAIGRLAPHSSHQYRFGNGESCTLSLDGSWDFRYTRLASQPFGEWGTITVPGHIQMQGGPDYPYGTPHYVNTQYPWDGHEELRPGQLPCRYDPVGEYRRMFRVPEHWKNCFIRFEGVDSALALFCNGKFAGYSESSFDTAEFDLSELVHPGENTLTAKVYRFCSGSWLEDQDFWRMSGIFRPVTLFTKPATHVEDIRMETEFSAGDTHAAVQFICRLSGELEGNIGLSFAGQFDEQPLAETVVLRVEVDHPELWSAEHPKLYDAAFVVHGTDDEMVEIAGFKAGLRHFALENGVMTLNGKRIVFKGVCRHEWSAAHGRAVTEEETEWDILNLKRHNVNAVRTSHYPNRNFLYDLCDRYGLYVIDETNLETHGTWQKRGAVVPDENTLPGDKPEWKEAVLARGRAMLERDKNHPCVLLWSCGNESYGGTTLKALHDWFRKADPSRLVHYEGVFHDRNHADTSDVESQMYTPAAEVEAFLQTHRNKPFVMCEYGHAMGNSCGELEAYTELAYREPMFQGGFLWEYMDHAMFYTLPDGRRGLCYGGDFGDRPTDAEFCVDGLVTATRVNSPKMQAVAGVYQDFVLDVTREGVCLENRSLFTDLSDYDLVFTLTEDGNPLETCTQQAALAPGEKCTIPLPIEIPNRNGCFALTAQVVLRQDCPWAKAGTPVAAGQAVFDCVGAEPEPACAAKENIWELVRGDYNYGVHTKDGALEVLFSRSNGMPISLRVNGHEALAGAVQLDFWRAPTNNDRGAALTNRFARWALAGRYAQCDGLKAEELPGGVTLEGNFRLATDTQEPVCCRWEFLPNGRCAVSLCWQGGYTELPGFGLLFPLAVGYQDLEWFGRGPAENMPDRKAGALVGRWHTSVRSGLGINVMPQEYAARTDVREAVLCGRGLAPLHFAAAPGSEGFVFSAQPWLPQELENADHEWQLPPITRTVARVALDVYGVGGDNSWGALPHEEYRFALNPDTTFCFTLGV